MVHDFFRDKSISSVFLDPGAAEFCLSELNKDPADSQV